MQPTKRKRGFATYSHEQLRAVSRRGGIAKVRKGLGTLSPERRREIAKMGALAAHEKRKQKRKEMNG